MGDSGGGNTTVTQTNEPPEWLQPYLQSGADSILPMITQQYMNGAWPVYPGQRVADINDTQQYAGRMLENFMGNNPWAPGLNQSWNSVTSGNATQAQMNPYADAMNPYAGMENRYAGDNPYLQDVIDRSNADITKNYERTTSPQLASAQVRGSSYGSALGNQQQADAEKQLADSLAANTSNLRYGNYNQSAQLEQQRLQNLFGAGSQQVGNLYGAGGQYVGNQNANQENALQRQLSAIGLYPGLNSSFLNNTSALMGWGDTLRQAQQDYLTGQQQQWQEGAFGPLSGANAYLNALRGLAGWGGTSITNSNMPGASPWGTLGGLGLLGATMI